MGAGVTPSVALPACPSDVSVIATEPAVTAVVRPVVETVATSELFPLQATARFASSFPLASRATAVNDSTCPTNIVSWPGKTVTDATGTGAPGPPSPPPPPHDCLLYTSPSPRD